MSGAAGGGSGAGAGAGAGAVVRQGHLRKLKTMKKKFFVLRAETADCSARLEYYESEKKFRAGAAPRRVLPLKTCYNIMRRLDLKQKHVIALFTREEQFCIVAENEQDLHAWLTAILKQHRTDDASEELLHPIQHVWQVNVQKKGLGATKTIQGLYNLCLTDKTLALVKIKSHNNVISDLGIPERVEYSLKNIRRCGDSECFFYMEVGRQTTTGAGELWMHTDDSNIAQSMHSTIYHAMRNCAKENENERDHIVLPKGTPEGNNAFRPRGWSYNGSDKAGSASDTGLCVGSCIKQCVCSSASYSVEDTAAAAAPLPPNAEHQSNTLTDKKENPPRLTKHNRTGSLPAGCALFQEQPLKIVHTRTKSAPLTGDELDRMVVEKSVMHSSCKAINGTDTPPAPSPAPVAAAKRTQWARRASTGTRLFKLSPAHSKNVASTLRSRCATMPSQACPSFEVERPPPRYTDLDGVDSSRDEPDACAADWHRTPRIPEEPDCVDISRDFITTALAGIGSIQHSRTSSMGEGGLTETVPEGYLPMAPGHEPLGGLISASSGSVCSGTPSTDPRFSEYQLEPATSHIGMESRPPRANSVGSRPSGSGSCGGGGGGAETRHRAYSVGARVRPPRHHAAAPPLPLPLPLPLHAAHALSGSRHSTEDHMEIDFSYNSPANRVPISRTPPVTGGLAEPRVRANANEYVDMLPHNAGYVEMKPGSPGAGGPPPPAAAAAVPDGYVPMNYSRPATRPIAISTARPPSQIATSPEDSRRPAREIRTPHGSQTLFPFSPDSPASPAEPAAAEPPPPPPPQPHQLSTVREMAEDGRRSPDLASSPQYVVLARLAAPPGTPEPADELSCNPTATKTIARIPDPMDTRVDTTATATVVLAGGGAAARFSLGDTPRSPPPPPSPGATATATAAAAAAGVSGTPLNYAALDLEPRRAAATVAQRAYTQIDFIRSEKLHAADAT